MQDKFKNLLKKLYFVTAHPDADWLKIFTGGIILVVLSLCWSVYTYFGIQSKISDSATVPVHSRAISTTDKSDDLNTIISRYQAKKVRYESSLQSKPEILNDPASY